jgi:antitoxin VapB
MTLTTARVGTNNRSQIVTIPLAFRFPDNIKTVYVRKIGDDLVLSPRPDNWADFLGLGPQVSEDFMTTSEDQAIQEREPL